MSNEPQLKLEDYHILANELEEIFARRTKEKMASLDDLVFLMDKTFFILSAGLSEHKTTKLPEVHDIFHFLLARSLKTFRSVRNLLVECCDQDALALSRNLVENTITAAYLSKGNVIENCERFRAFEWIEKNKNINKHRRVEPNWVPFKGENGTKLVETIQKMASSYIKKYGRNTQNWSGKNIEVMATEANMYNDYVQSYGVFCFLTHPTYISAPQYFPDDVSHSSPSWTPTTRHAIECAVLACSYLMKMIDIYQSVLGVEDAKFLDSVNEVKFNFMSKLKKFGFEQGVQPYAVSDGTWGILPEELKTQR